MDPLQRASTNQAAPLVGYDTVSSDAALVSAVRAFAGDDAPAVLSSLEPVGRLAGSAEARERAEQPHVHCLVESGDPENNKKMRTFAPKLIDYRDQADIWSYMYSDTLSRYFRWRANEQADENQKELFMKEALALSDEALSLAANDEEVKKFHAKLIDETDPVSVDAAV